MASMIVLAVFALCIGHPGLVFDNSRRKAALVASGGESAEMVGEK